jgi:hypothetical protein
MSFRLCLMHSVSCRPVSVARNRHVHFHHEGRSYPYLAAVKSERRQQLLRAHWRRYVRPRDFAFVCSANFKCSVVSCSPHHYNNNARVPPTWLTTADQTKADRGERGERIEGGREDGDEAAVDAVQDKVMVVDVVVDVAVDVMYIISVVVMGINRVVDSKEVVAMGIRVVLVLVVLGIKVVVSRYDSNIDQNINRSQATIPHRRQRCRRRRGRSLGLRHCSSPRSATTSTSVTSALRASIPGLPIACGADNPRATAILTFATAKTTVASVASLDTQESPALRYTAARSGGLSTMAKPQQMCSYDRASSSERDWRLWTHSFETFRL